MGKSQEERQKETENSGQLERIDRYFRKLWAEFEITRVSVVVVGQREGTRPGDPQLEVVYSIAVDSKHAIPHAGQGKSVGGKGGNRFTFVQVANSVFTHSYTAALSGTYTGSDPPTEPNG